MLRVFSVPRISSASSKPFMPGICTSRMARANSCSSSSDKALGRLCLVHLAVLALDQRFEGQQVFRQVVDDQQFGDGVA
jgi:hypothetical protein